MKRLNTGYGVAYERDDVQFIDSAKIALDLENLRYMVHREMPFPSQQAAFDEICAHKDVMSLRRSIAALGLGKPIEVIPFKDQAYTHVVYEGNRRLVALRLLKEETGDFTLIACSIVKPLGDPETRRNYGFIAHGPAAQKSWNSPARWAEPYRLYHEAKLSFGQIADKFALGEASVARNLRGYELWMQYRTWLWKTHTDDSHLGTRLATFSIIRTSDTLHKWFKADPEAAYKLIADDKLKLTSGHRIEFEHVVQSPRLLKILALEGFKKAMLELLKTGFEKP